jgi:hypothetical protein
MLRFEFVYIVWCLCFLTFTFCALHVLWHFTFCDAKHYETYTFLNFYVLYAYVVCSYVMWHTRFVTFMLCAATLCSNTQLFATPIICWRVPETFSCFVFSRLVRGTKVLARFDLRKSYTETHKIKHIFLIPMAVRLGYKHWGKRSHFPQTFRGLQVFRKYSFPLDLKKANKNDWPEGAAPPLRDDACSWASFNQVSRPASDRK